MRVSAHGLALVPLLALLAPALSACSATTDVYIGQDHPAASAVTDSAAGPAAATPEPAPPAAGDAAATTQRPPDPPPPPPAVMDAGSAGSAGSGDEPGEDDEDEESPDQLDAAVTPVPGCSTGTADCDGNPANGCEAATDSDMQHCGGCDRLCHANGHDARAAQCVAGRCELQCSTDPFGDHDCDFEPDNGCETPLRTDDQNCGQCGRVCTCFNGSCL